MKRIIIALAAILCVATVSAQKKFESSVKDAANTVVNTVKSQKWAIGFRAGTSVDFQTECFYSDKAYIQGIVGFNYMGAYTDNAYLRNHKLGVHFTFLHNWNCATWDWTPDAGTWFLDAGFGAGIGGNLHYVSFGVAGQVKFGFQFEEVPIRLALDITPVVGPWVDYNRYTVKDEVTGDNVKVNGPNEWHFHEFGLANAAIISATYCF